MKKRFSVAILITTFLILISGDIAHAYPQILGKKDAKGQEKKQTIEVNVGRIENIKPDKIEIKNQDKKIEVKTNSKTIIFEKPSNKKINFGQLKKDDQIATFATGSAQATESAKTILVKPATDSAKLNKRRAIYGLIREVNGNTLIISHPIKDNPRYSIQVTDETSIKIKSLDNAAVGDIKVGDRVTAVGDWINNVLVAKRVHVIPGKAIGLMEKIATRSATPSASLPATPSASPF